MRPSVTPVPRIVVARVSVKPHHTGLAHRLSEALTARHLHLSTCAVSLATRGVTCGPRSAAARAGFRGGNVIGCLDTSLPPARAEETIMSQPSEPTPNPVPSPLRNDTVCVGIHVPSVAVAPLGSGETYAAFFRQVESLGFDAVWTEDRLFHPANLLDSVVLLTWAAANTRRLLLGTAVMLLNLRQAPVVARQVASLQHLCGGRLALGVSLGGRPEEYAALGVPMAKRVAVFRESVAVLRQLLAGQPVTHQGPYFRLQDATVRPAARIPLLVGGLVEDALRRAGELADGWIMGPFGSAQDFRRGWRIVQDAARAAGKNPDALVAGRLLYVVADDNRTRARETLGAFLHGYYGPRFDVDAHAIFGPSREVTARLREQVEAGITHLMLGVPTLDHAHLRRLAEQVVPGLRS
jgi:alkanesulfonate monooxygenase SsuD/methylene tetrahydromethanopterin reductase-like flavin-dependent oxidoreductase (luciferase family)